MKLYEIANVIEKNAPIVFAYEWDNVGILCGEADKEVKKVLCCLDCDINAVNEAIILGVDLIISHHPIMFRGIKKVNDEKIDARIVKALIKNDIALYSAHTNMDSATVGVDSCFCRDFGLCDVNVLELRGENVGIGRIGTLEKEMGFNEFLNKVKAYFDVSTVRVAGDFNKNVKRVAICGGDGGDFLEVAQKNSADVFISGDLKYHMVKDAVHYGLNVIDVGHFHSEKKVMKVFYDILKGELGDNVEVFICDVAKDVFVYC